MINVYEQVDRNKIRSTIIVVLFIVFITLVAWVFTQAFGFGLDLVGLALIFSGLMSFAGYFWGDKMILSLSQAREASRKTDFKFYTVTENLCLAAQIHMPRLYVIDDSAPNAFATGRNPEHAVVCATTGLLEKLDRTELEGVVAHELSHIKNYDILLMSLVTILVGMVTLLADWFLRGARFGRSDRNQGGQIQAIFFSLGFFLALLSPLVAQLIKLALSRRREFYADAQGVMITRYPEGLARALEKIAKDPEPLEVANKATAHLYIVNPFKGKKLQGKMSNLFNTHPPLEERIRILREMS